MRHFSNLSHCLVAAVVIVGVLSLSVRGTRGEDADPPGAYKAPAPDPSPVETLMLEYINRCRANPHEDGVRGSADSGVPSTVDLEMFAKEMSSEPGAPPLVFDLRLLKAARWHSHYQVLHGQSHDEVAGKEGFTGANPAERVKKVGFSGGHGENAFVGPKDPWQCHLGYIVDWGPGGTGGMQPKRGHRRNILNADFRVAGIGAVPYDGDTKFACTHSLGMSKERFVGGVVINDRNKNRFYDMGEGISGVPLAASEFTLKSWFSGAYTLPISRTKSKMTVELEGKKYAVLLPDGDDNVKFDIFVNDKSSFNLATTLLAAYKKIPDDKTNDTRRLISEIDLCYATQGTLVDEKIFDEVLAIVEPARQKLDDEMNQVRKALATDSIEGARKAAKAGLQKYARTKARPWFADAVICVEVKDGLQSTSELKSGDKPVPPAVLARTLKKQQSQFQQLTIPEWKKLAQDWGTKTAALGGE